jgi:cell wall-associated NlpC family hydrolase
MSYLKYFLFVFILTTTSVFAQNNIKHKVVQGESIYSIAKKYDVKEAAIYELNPDVKGKALQLKTVLTIPSSVQISNVSLDKLPENHKVEKGESFYSISKKYKMTVAQLQELNPSITPQSLKFDDVLNLSKSKIIAVLKSEVNKEAIKTTKDLELNKETATVENEFTHKVLPKETKYGISKKYGVSIAELERLNPEIISGLAIGVVLKIKEIEKVEVEVAEVFTETILSNTSLPQADFLIDKASGYLGTRYRSGGTSASGFDCSGLMFTTFKEIDMTLPRSSRDMAKYGFEVSKSNAQKGDLIFFTTNRKGTISHVGMITEVSDDEIKFIHSSTSSGVIISSTNEDYYQRTFVQINRVLN